MKEVGSCSENVRHLGSGWQARSAIPASSLTHSVHIPCHVSVSLYATIKNMSNTGFKENSRNGEFCCW